MAIPTGALAATLAAVSGRGGREALRSMAQYGAATGVFREYFIGILTHIYRGF